MTEKQIKDQSIHELNLIKRDFRSIKEDVESSLLVKDVEKRFNKLFSKSNAIKLLVEPGHGNIVDANGKACEFYGYALHDLKKRKITEINKLTEQEVIEEYKRQQDEERDFFRNKQLVASGDIVPVEVRSTRIVRGRESFYYFLIHEDKNGEKRYVEIDLDRHKESISETAESAPLMFAKDLDSIEQTARDLVTLTKKLTESEQKLRELNASKDRFFSIISHDLKNNFASVLGLSKLLTQPAYDENAPSRKETAGLLHTSSQKLYTLLENLLDWAKLQKDEIRFGPSRFGLKEAADEIIDLFKLKADEKGIVLTNEIPGDIGVYADLNMIKTVLRNLTANAINFTNKDGSVILKAEIESDLVQVSVEDTGIGIEEKNLDKLFRIDEKYIGLTTEGQKGTGLGLILCKEFVEKNKGVMWVESSVDEGSTFKFTLPI